MDEVPAPKKFSVPVLIAVVVVVLAILGTVAWLAFRNSSSHRTVARTNVNVTQQKPITSTKPTTVNATTATKCQGIIKARTLAILYQASGAVPSCQKVNSTQNLVVINNTAQAVKVSYAGMNFTIQAHKDYQLNKQFGSYLNKGIYNMTFAGGATAQIWEQ